MNLYFPTINERPGTWDAKSKQICYCDNYFPVTLEKSRKKVRQQIIRSEAHRLANGLLIPCYDIQRIKLEGK